MSTEPDWCAYLVVHGLDLEQDQAVPIFVGLITTPAGGTQIALRLGEDGQIVVLPLQAAREMGSNLHEIMSERLKIAGEGT